MPFYKCFLVSADDKHPPIHLPNRSECQVGRKELKALQDKRLSMFQVQLTAHCKERMVQVCCVGRRPSILNNLKLLAGHRYIMRESSVLYFLKGMYPHKLKFLPVDSKTGKVIEGANAGDSNQLSNSTGKNRQIKTMSGSEDNSSSGNEDDDILRTVKKSAAPGEKSVENRTKKSEQKKEHLKKRPKSSGNEHSDEESKRKRMKTENNSSNKDVDASRSKKSKETIHDHDKETQSTTNKRELQKHPRSSDPSGNEFTAKRAKVEDVSDSDSSGDEDDFKTAAARLKQMQEAVKKPAAKNTSDKGRAGSSEGKSHDVPHRQGAPLPTAAWEDPADTLMVYKSAGLRASSKIAAFDIDGTIICTQSGKVFPTHPGDWRILYPDIPGALKKLSREEYKIVFITNQMGIQRGKVKVPEFRDKVQNIAAKLGIPVHVLVSKGSGPYRKPGQGMWDHLIHKDNEGIEVDIGKSMYIGDAAGRPKDWAQGKKKDFSCSDRLFAINAGVQFYTPEEYFLKQSRAKFNMPEFDPRKLDPNMPLLSPASAKLVSKNQEVIVLVGSPACGKSHFAKHNFVLKGYVYVNRDTLKTWQKCVSMCQKAVESGKSVVIDNTNPDVESRKRYIDVAKAKKVDCRCFVFNVSIQQAKHNERFREMTDKSHQSINDMVMNSYKSKFSEPSTSEGFVEVVKVNFVPHFRDKAEETLYKQFLIDK